MRSQNIIIVSCFPEILLIVYLGSLPFAYFLFAVYSLLKTSFLL